MRNFFLWISNETGFLVMKSTCGEDVVKTVEATAKDLEYYKNLVDEVVAGFERLSKSLQILLFESSLFTSGP